MTGHIYTLRTRIQSYQVAFALIVILIAPSQAAEFQLLEQGTAVFERVREGDVQAARELAELRRQISGQLLGAFRQGVGKLDSNYEGKTHLLLRALQAWRVREAVPLLAEVIAFRLDKSSFPPYMKYPHTALYPVAETLVGIGDVAVLKAMVENIKTHQDPRAHSVSAWVLWKTCGETIAHDILSAEVVRENDASRKQNLMRGMKILSKGDGILLEQ